MARLGRQRSEPNTWPGFVDALATLLMVIIFLLMIFVLAQFFLGQAIVGRDEALSRLQGQVSELADLLSLERQSNTDLRRNVGQLAGELQSSVEQREDLAARLEALALRAEQAEGESGRLNRSLEEAFRTMLADKGTIEQQTRQLAGLANDIAALRALREEMQQEVAAMASRLAQAEQQRDTDKTTVDEQAKRLALLTQDVAGLTELRAKLEKQVSELAVKLGEAESARVSEQELLRIARAQLDDKDTKLADQDDVMRAARAQLDASRAELAEEKEVSESARAQLALLNRQMATLRDQLVKLSAALEASESVSADQKVEITTLGARLNAALASRVQELSRYRSEFFGRLREVLGDHPGVRIVGDRFVFQSEVLFDTGSADIGDAGREQLSRLADTLTELAMRIPPQIDWVLRVDGHTDRVPIATARFPSNWELSSARAISVVKLLMERGIPANRLAATGFGEFQPLDGSTNPAALSRNRRIELKLTER